MNTQREIRFRAWDKKGRKMLDLQKLTPLATELNGLFLPFNDDSILMQFTGLLDKGGKEIYEGDIVDAIAEKQYKEHTIISDIISSGVNSSAWEVRCNKDATHGLHLMWGGWISLEIIGNIYENPELLST